MSARKTTEQFIAEARAVHGEDTYDYSKSEYINAKTNVCIICSEHGEFWQLPRNHCAGTNCPICAKIQWDIAIRTPRVKQSLKDLYPNVCKEWSTDNILSPDNYNVCSNARVWWECNQCSYKWQAQICARTNSGTNCPKCSRKLANKALYKGGQYITGAEFSTIRYGAKVRNFCFEITIDDIEKTYEQQNKKCRFTNELLVFNTIHEPRGTASVDRIISSKGYTKNNIQIVHKVVNYMKGTMSDNEFVDWCYKISTNSGDSQLTEPRSVL